LVAKLRDVVGSGGFATSLPADAALAPSDDRASEDARCRGVEKCVGNPCRQANEANGNVSMRSHAGIRPDQDRPLTRWQATEIAIRELLVEKSLLTPRQISAAIEAMDARGPELGARVVARAWTDDGFRERLLTDPPSACVELGIELDGMRLIVLPNTPTLHNVVVCTLCSCYPRALLGLPPDWYKLRAYRSRTVREPRAVLREFGLEIPPGTDVRVHDSTAEMRYMVLPLQPAATEGWPEERLAGIVTRDCMIGVAVPRPEEAPALSTQER